jgi:hypothetical protein
MLSLLENLRESSINVSRRRASSKINRRIPKPKRYVHIPLLCKTRSTSSFSIFNDWIEIRIYLDMRY